MYDRRVHDFVNIVCILAHACCSELVIIILLFVLKYVTHVIFGI